MLAPNSHQFFTLSNLGPYTLAQYPAQVVADEALLAAVLGPRRFLAHDAAHRVSEAGSVAGLVWTEAGGQVQYVECAATSRGQPGRRGALQMTGQVPGGGLCGVGEFKAGVKYFEGYA